MNVKKIYIHPLPVRIWHWSNAVGFVLLILTGLQIRYRDLIGIASFEASVRLHNYVGFVLMGSYLLWLVFYLTSDKIKNYQMELSPKKFYTTAVKQALYYGYGIFRGKENPHHASAYTKFNPLQKLTYDLIMLLVVPIQFVTGLFLWDVNRFAGAVAALGGVRTVDTVHVLLFIFFSAFLPVHAYLATLGHTPLAHFKAMFTGYEEEFEHATRT
jgi:thiosulfate reductase cytochrome b subunit